MNRVATMNAGIANKANTMVMQAEGAALELEIELEEAEMAADVMAAAYGMVVKVPVGMMPMGLARWVGSSAERSKSTRDPSGKAKKSSSDKGKSKSGSSGGQTTKRRK